MTPKEALEKVLSYVHLDEYDYVTSGVLDSQQIIEQSLTELEELKRYPTSEEVREALQLFWGNNYKVNVSITNQIFIESKKDKDGDSCIEWDGEKNIF